MVGCEVVGSIPKFGGQNSILRVSGTSNFNLTLRCRYSAIVQIVQKCKRLFVLKWRCDKMGSLSRVWPCQSISACHERTIRKSKPWLASNTMKYYEIQYFENLSFVSFYQSVSQFITSISQLMVDRSVILGPNSLWCEIERWPGFVDIRQKSK